MAHIPAKVVAAVVPDLPGELIAAEIIARFPLRHQLRLRRTADFWNKYVIPAVRRVVLMNRLMIDPVICDHDLKRHNRDRVSVTVHQMGRAKAFLRKCRNLQSLMLWRLSLNHLLQLPSIPDVFQRLTTLELYKCEELFFQDDNQEIQYYNLIGDLLEIPHKLKVFRYTASNSYFNMAERVQTLLDNNKELAVLKIYEHNVGYAWNLQFRTRMQSVHIKVKTTEQFWESLTTSSRYYLTSFTSEVYSPNQHHLVQNYFLSLRTFRCHLIQEMVEMQFPHIHLTTFALLSNIQNRDYEHFLAVEYVRNLTILDLSGVLIRLADTLRDLCRHCPFLQILRFRSDAPLSQAVKNAMRALEFLEELQILNGHYMIPRNQQNIPVPEAMDKRVAFIARRCKRLRVLIVRGGAGALTKDAMTQKALSNPDTWFFIDLNNPLDWTDEPPNLKWIARYQWRTVFYGFEGDYFDWKLLKD